MHRRIRPLEQRLERKMGNLYSPKGEANIARSFNRVISLSAGEAGMNARPGAANGAIGRRRILETIQLLCSCGAGLEAIASPLCAAVRSLLGADSVALFWLDGQSSSQGFYHDCAPAEVKDAFINRYEELFSGPDEVTVIDLAVMTGPSIGICLEPPFMEKLWRSNVYRYLFEPSGHRYLIDMRVDVGGRGRAVLLAFNKAAAPFDQTHADLLAPVQTMMERAILGETGQVRWRARGTPGLLVTDQNGERLMAIDARAESLLKAGQLLYQNISLTQPVDKAPPFVKGLAQMLKGGEAVMPLAVPDGRLTARAHPIRAIGGDGASLPHLSITLELEVAAEVLAVGYLSGLPLSPLQREIALFAMLGGERADCQKQFGVSHEALKKHLRAIFSATDQAKWTDLAQIAL
jgi:hypothetical protein